MCAAALTHVALCFLQVGDMASENKVLAALGQPFTLGMLYDARKDELIPGNIQHTQ